MPSTCMGDTNSGAAQLSKKSTSLGNNSFSQKSLSKGILSIAKPFVVVHKRMFYIRANLRMLQHSKVECNIRMFVLCNKMMYFGDFVFLAA